MKFLLKYQIILKNFAGDEKMIYAFGKSPSEIIQNLKQNDSSIAENRQILLKEDKEYYIDKINFVEICNSDIMDAPPEKLKKYLLEKFKLNPDNFGWKRVNSDKIECYHLNNDYNNTIDLKETDFEDTYLGVCPICGKIFFNAPLIGNLKLKPGIEKVIVEEKSENMKVEEERRTRMDSEKGQKHITVVAVKVSEVSTLTIEGSLTRDDAIKKFKEEDAAGNLQWKPASDKVLYITLNKYLEE